MTAHAEGCSCYLADERTALGGYPNCDRSCPECECCEVERFNSGQPQPCLLLQGHEGEHVYVSDSPAKRG